MKASAVFGALAVAAFTLLAGCDPCAGVASCVSTPRLAIEGSVVEHLSGLPQQGVRIDVVRTGGGALSTDSVSATTDASGHWQIAIPAQSVESVTVDINVRSSLANYRVTNVVLSTTDRRGGETVLPPWVVDPYFPYALELHYQGFGDTRIGGVEFHFFRTGGVAYSTDQGGEEYTDGTEPSGRAALFELHAHASSLGDLIGNLVVDLPSPLPPDTIRDLHLAATPLLQAPVGIVVVQAGPSLAYVGEFHARSTGKPAS